MKAVPVQRMKVPMYYNLKMAKILIQENPTKMVVILPTTADSMRLLKLSALFHPDDNYYSHEPSKMVFVLQEYMLTRHNSHKPSGG